MLTKFALVACLAGLAMLITGLLPQDKMDKIQAFMVEREKNGNRPPVRLQLLVGGAAFLFIGLVMLRVIRL